MFHECELLQTIWSILRPNSALPGSLWKRKKKMSDSMFRYCKWATMFTNSIYTARYLFFHPSLRAPQLLHQQPFCNQPFTLLLLACGMEFHGQSNLIKLMNFLYWYSITFAIIILDCIMSNYTHICCQRPALSQKFVIVILFLLCTFQHQSTFFQSNHA